MVSGPSLGSSTSATFSTLLSPYRLAAMARTAQSPVRVVRRSGLIDCSAFAALLHPEPPEPRGAVEMVRRDVWPYGNLADEEGRGWTSKRATAAGIDWEQDTW